MSVFSTIDSDDWIAHNDHAFAIRDGFPVTPGHALVISKRVVPDWWSANPDEQRAILELVGVVKRRLDAERAPSGYNVGFNAGTAAGQTVDHLHVHVIPRYDGDVDDPRGGVRHVIPGQGNYLSDSPTPLVNPGTPTLVTPLDGELKLELLRCLIRDDFDRINLLVSFVMRSGVRLVANHLDEALARGAHVRLLTTDYLQITDTAALGFFLDRLDVDVPGRLEARVFSDPITSFHPKAYLFSNSETGEGKALVGSSNLSLSGITRGVEWNVRTSNVADLNREFDRLWDDYRSLPLTAGWLRDYDLIRKERVAADVGDQPTADSSTDVALVAAAAKESEGAPEPWSVQSEALAALEAARHDGHGSGLVVMATGLGKTWLAAFDSTRPAFRRVLFVAHREEVLTQARDVYRQVRPGGHLSMFTGAGHDTTGEVTFASVQSLARHLDQFDPADYDYVVVDEFHHAAAASYRKVMAHFRPRFLLGLTATPDRADAADLLALCGDNLVYDCGLVEGVRRGLLSTFTYRAIPDVADYEHIPWRSGRFDAEELTTALATTARADKVFDEWQQLGGDARHTLGFCSTIVHADFMAEQFRAKGVAAVAVHSGVTSAPRAESLERLENGQLSVVFTVDLFNEGVDVPAVDLVLLLRPTESPVVFFQQLGRGLRRAEGKDRLDALDLVGNHRSFLLKARLLAALAGRSHLTDREAVKFLADHANDEAGIDDLPEGCSIIVDTEVIDLLTQLTGRLNERDRLVELARQWVDDHDQQRPTALELALVNGKPFTLKSGGGWFGFLNQIGMLSEDEARIVDTAAEFLLWIEHGSYSKSYKLITLAELARTGGLRTGARVDELADACRWAVLRDPQLRVDLNDATGSFAEVSNPTRAEWLVYWRKNPIAALCNAKRGSEPWFVDSDGQLELTFAVPVELGDTFDAMVAEIAEYRLYRYLTQQKARQVGEERMVHVDGHQIDATFVVESTDGRPSSVVIESAGGTKGSKSARNLDYVAGFDAVLSRLALLDAQLLNAAVDTTRTSSLPLADRRLEAGNDLAYPIVMQDVADLEAMRKQFLGSMRQVGKAPGAKGSGNSRKRVRLVIAVDDEWDVVRLADALADGSIGGGVPGVREAPDDSETA